MLVTLIAITAYIVYQNLEISRNTNSVAWQMSQLKDDSIKVQAHVDRLVKRWERGTFSSSGFRITDYDLNTCIAESVRVLRQASNEAPAINQTFVSVQFFDERSLFPIYIGFHCFQEEEKIYVYNFVVGENADVVGNMSAPLLDEFFNRDKSTP